MTEKTVTLEEPYDPRTALFWGDLLPRPASKSGTARLLLFMKRLRGISSMSQKHGRAKGPIPTH